MFDRFGIVMVVVSDMTRSVAFYRDVLKLKLRFESPGWSEFDVGGVTLGLHPCGKHLPVGPSGGISFGFYTSDIDAVLSEVAHLGVQVASRTEEDFGTLAIVNDPDGYGIQICQVKPHAQNGATEHD